MDIFTAGEQIMRFLFWILNYRVTIAGYDFSLMSALVLMVIVVALAKVLHWIFCD